ncbi:MAG: protein kinase domain-containing protein [Aureliella sp.]
MTEQNPEQSIFLHAIELASAVDRAAYLDRACGDGSELRAGVDALLAAHDRLSGAAPRPIQPEPTRAPWALRGEDAGRAIGPYTLLEQIGEGGMGAVWMAEQREPIRRRVALKVIKAGMDSKQVLARFEAERQALALMDHPNIARVLDAGMTGTGRPYFVMELVKGAPITHYCDDKHLSVRERLELFGDVCRAVQHAHQKGIIHRDLKPSNILIAPFDGKPVVKVIDFGVAKATGQRLTNATLFTGFGAVVGTPEYMSPEQAEINNEDIDTRSDIYSLGVLLYELLTGSTPLTKKRVKEAALLEVLRVIREEEPPKPSTRLSSTEELPSISAQRHTQRHTERAKLTSLVRGELDWIVMKALEKDRSRRYETASGLARDIERHLHNETVIACPPSLAYRLRKAARRYTSAVATAAAIVLSLVLGLIGTTWQAIRAKVAEHNLTVQRDLAVKSEGDARASLRRAQNAEQISQENLWKSYLDQAQARRFSGRMGRRFESLSALQKAAEIRPSLELRNEAIACMALVDLRVAKEWEGAPGGSNETTAVSLDPKFELYARSDEKGNISVRRVADDREEQLFTGPGSPSWTLRFSPDSQLLLATYCQEGASDLGQFSLWNLALGKTILRIEPPTNQSAIDGSAESAVVASAIDFSSDSRMVAIGRPDRSIQLFSTVTGGEVARLRSSVVCHSIGISPTGDRILVSNLHENTVEVLDCETGKVLHRLSCYRPLRPAWHPDGVWFAVGSGSKIALWNAATGKLEREWEGHPHSVVDHLAFNHAGNLLATSCWAGRLALWDPYSGKRLLEAPDHASRGPHLQFSSDDKLLGHNIVQSKIQIWEIAQQKECQQLYGTGGKGAAFHPEGRVIAAADDRGVRLWDRATAKSLAWWPSLGSSVKFHPAGNSLVYTGAGLKRRSIEITEADFEHRWKLGPPQTLWTVSDGESGVDLSRDGTMAAVVNWSSGNGVVLDWDDPLRQISLTNHPRMGAIAISPDQRWIATGTFKGWGIKIWDATTGGFLRQLPDDLYNGRGLAFSPDGQWLVTGTMDEYRVWAVGDWKPVHSIRRDRSFIACPVAFSPDGRILAISSSSTTLKLIDATRWEEVATLVPPDQQPFESLAFSRDGTCLAVSAHGVLQVWDLGAIYRQLAKMGLDENFPAVNEEAPNATGARSQLVPLKVELVQAELSAADG